MGQIIAMGGGGFWMEPENPLLDRYVLHSCPAEHPRICFLPTASGDSEARIQQFHEAFGKYDCETSCLSLFRDPSRRAEHIRGSDIIYVGGGNTRLMLAAWKTYGVDTLLREAWEAGKLLCGLSAGAICWFEEGVTDSDGPLGPMACLGWLPGSCVPHYDGEAERRPVYHQLLQAGRIGHGIALDDGAAIHFDGDQVRAIVASRPHAHAWEVGCMDGRVSEKRLPTRFLGSGTPPA